LVITGTVNTSGRRITFNGGKNSTLTNVVSGSGSITQSGVGALTLSGNNTYSGGTSLSAGALIIGSNTALGTGALTISAGTLATNGTARTLTNTNTVNGSFTFNSPSDLTLSGTAALGNNITVTVSGVGALTFGGIVSGSTRILTKAGTGTLTLYTALAVTNGTTITECTGFANIRNRRLQFIQSGPPDFDGFNLQQDAFDGLVLRRLMQAIHADGKSFYQISEKPRHLSALGIASGDSNFRPVRSNFFGRFVF
jgi:autotransporter-associated beta strand protein